MQAEVAHACEPPLRRIETGDNQFPVMLDIDHLPDGRPLAEGMRWRCPICLAKWGVERPAPNVFVPSWRKLTTGRAARFRRWLSRFAG